jgi:hypothetical protein
MKWIQVKMGLPAYNYQTTVFCNLNNISAITAALTTSMGGLVVAEVELGLLVTGREVIIIEEEGMVGQQRKYGEFIGRVVVGVQEIPLGEAGLMMALVGELSGMDLELGEILRVYQPQQEAMTEV